MSYFGYERVSTGGQDLENQRLALERFASAKGIAIKRFYGDVCGYPGFAQKMSFRAKRGIRNPDFSHGAQVWTLRPPLADSG